MIGVTSNSPQQINAALIAMRNEVKQEIIIETKFEKIKSAFIDDSRTSTTKTWSSEKIESKTSYPLGFVYMQLYNPTLKTWEKDPNQLGMTPASDCRWEEITSDFASFPYLKIGTGTTQSGHNAYHSHTGGNLKIEGQIGTVADGSKQALFSMSGWGGWSPAYYPGYDSYTVYTNNNGHSNLYHNGTNWSGTTSYDGKSNEQTVEVNASNIRIWKVIKDV